MQHLKKWVGSLVILLSLTSCGPKIKMDIEDLAINECGWIRFETLKVDIHMCRTGEKTWLLGKVRNAGSKTEVDDVVDR